MTFFTLERVCGVLIIITKETNLHFEMCSVVCSMFPCDYEC